PSPNVAAAPAHAGAGSAGSNAVAAPTGTAALEQIEEQNANAATKVKDLSKGDQEDAEWVPAEHKKGAARWKDVGVYVDGKPISFLTFGELPITLQPTWVKDKVSQNKPASCP